MILKRIVTEDGVEFVSETGRLSNMHKKTANCEQGCVIHHPTPSSMSDFPYNWRTDRHMMERICPHGIGHPDLDQRRFWIQRLPHKSALAEMSHGCDGCCSEDSQVINEVLNSRML